MLNGGGFIQEGTGIFLDMYSGFLIVLDLKLFEDTLYSDYGGKYFFSPFQKVPFAFVSSQTKLSTAQLISNLEDVRQAVRATAELQAVAVGLKVVGCGSLVGESKRKLLGARGFGPFFLLPKRLSWVEKPH